MMSLVLEAALGCLPLWIWISSERRLSREMREWMIYRKYHQTPASITAFPSIGLKMCITGRGGRSCWFSPLE